MILVLPGSELQPFTAIEKGNEVSVALGFVTNFYQTGITQLQFSPRPASSNQLILVKADQPMISQRIAG